MWCRGLDDIVSLVVRLYCPKVTKTWDSGVNRHSRWLSREELDSFVSSTTTNVEVSTDNLKSSNNRRIMTVNIKQSKLVKIIK